MMQPLDNANHLFTSKKLINAYYFVYAVIYQYLDASLYCKQDSQELNNAPTIFFRFTREMHT